MKNNFFFLLFSVLIITWIIAPNVIAKNNYSDLHKNLAVDFKGKDSQIEIGGPFVGIEMHKSCPLLNRVSFFYPVANSIDVSTDYWKREEFRVMRLGIKAGNGKKEWLNYPFQYNITPYSVIFKQQDKEKNINISYDFCQNKPAMITRIEITNNSPRTEVFELYTELETSLKTSHTYKLSNKAWTEFDNMGSTIYTNFDYPDTGYAQIFVSNAGEIPKSFTTSFSDKEKNWWLEKNSDLPKTIIDTSYLKTPLSAFVYRKKLRKGEKMNVIQIIGSCKINEGKENVKYLLKNYNKETNLYKQTILDNVYNKAVLTTNNQSMDHSSKWAKAIIESNKHYLDKELVPMPCPAEYNFFFTHDTLLTDLAAVNYDIKRVKKDLEYIIKHADSKKIIPHAYYWKDNRYATEYVLSDNWNHFWFIILSSKYLRHSNDIATLKTLYPFITKSLEQMLINKKDNTIWAYRPDWWDIGNSFGPRSYMTILAIRALREFIYTSTVLGENVDKLAEYEQMALNMQKQLNAKLWSNDLKYLINYNKDGLLDSHFYNGSLLALHFNLLDEEKKNELLLTAQKKLLDEKLGIYNAFPMDYNLLLDYLKFSGNEAGDPFYYMNGGIWPHGTAWYALALMDTDKKQKAFEFMQNAMTLEGIMTGPNGQPAMYECRNGNKNNPSIYGKIDKPQFLWAGAWYIYCVYHLLGFNETEWNMYFEPYLLPNAKSSSYTLYVKGKPVIVNVRGKGNYIKNIKYDDKIMPSAVIPTENTLTKKIDIVLGYPETPYITYTDSALSSCMFDGPSKKFTINLKAFPKHQSCLKFNSPKIPQSIYINGEKATDGFIVKKYNDIYKISINFIHSSDNDNILIQF